MTPHVKNLAQDVDEGVLGAAGRGGREREGAHRGMRHLSAAEPTPNTRVIADIS